MKNIFIIFLIGLVSVSFGQTSEFSHDHNVTEVTVEGMGQTVPQAIEQAQRMAIDTAVGTYIVAETEINNYQTVKDKILAKSEAFVKKYEVLDKYKDEGDLWVVKIKAWISKDILLSDLEALGVLMSQLDNPSIVVFYAPKGVQYDKRYTEQAINQINQYFTTYRYDVYDLDQLNAMIEDDISMKQAALNEDVDMAEILAKKLKSDIYVTVSIILEDTGYGKKKAKATAKIFNASTAKLLGTQNGYSDEVRGNNTAYDRNIDQAVTKLMPLMMKQVKGYWKLQLDKGKMYVIQFSKLPKGRKVKKAVLDILRTSAKEVKKVSSTEFKIWINGSIDDYIDEIGDTLMNSVYKGKDFDYENRGDRINIFPVE
ncbi:MAG: hypothetical protein CR982_07715 [Candidatus Cloacimonadota bacterium]|nr:MAG: hypothetical protein CR982_07715 [Candidatus Cloacimonadota bacterium]PIE78258.1 MAG: hypothetical protein CSA15_08825 [Candidatus Delongbacteria bacterium]